MSKVPSDPPWGSVTLRAQEWWAPRGRGTRKLAEECGMGLCAEFLHLPFSMMRETLRKSQYSGQNHG